MVISRAHMRDEDDETLRDVERVQEELKRNIEESARLIGRAQDAIRRHRETSEGEKA